MNYEQADSLLGKILSPMTTDEFFDAVGRKSLFVKGAPGHERARLFGDDPKRTVLEAFATHSDRLDWHSASTKEPPPALDPAADPDAFLRQIQDFQDRGYTLRIPDVVSLSSGLQQFARALESILHKPVDSSLFWSKAGGGAMVHYDKRDNIIVHLEGRKRWFISVQPPGLQNDWKQVGEPVPQLGQHTVIDVEPGDLIYIPRGTPHNVESTSESLHLSILFLPVTLRDTIVAALDYLSDHDRIFRETAVRIPAAGAPADLQRKLIEGIARLHGHCQSPDLVREAMHMRSALAIGDLPALNKPASPPAVTGETRVRHSPLAISHIRPSLGSLDFSLPGNHIAVHPGVQQELEFIASTPDFRVSEIPGETSEDVRIALVSRLIASGFLEIAE